MSEKRDNQRKRILTWLQMRGAKGVLNTELTELCMRFGARIFELRKAGYDIKTIKLDESRYRFVLIEPDGSLTREMVRNVISACKEAIDRDIRDMGKRKSGIITLTQGSQIRYPSRFEGRSVSCVDSYRFSRRLELTGWYP